LWEEHPIYKTSVAGDRIRQGEILSNVLQVHLSLETLTAAEPVADFKKHPFAIVLTQDCDLEQDFERRQENEEPTLPNVLFCEVVTEDELKDAIPGSDIWKRVRANKDERYQYLRAVKAEQDARGEGTPALGIDFKRLFTVPTEEVYARIATGEMARRCRLLSPYPEHLSHRFCSFHMRVALPAEHLVKETQPQA